MVEGMVGDSLGDNEPSIFHKQDWWMAHGIWKMKLDFNNHDRFQLEENHFEDSRTDQYLLLRLLSFGCFRFT